MKQHSQGSVLLIALVFLLLLAIAGVASIRMNTNSSLIAQATIDRERAFQLAEAGLKRAESDLLSFTMAHQNVSLRRQYKNFNETTREFSDSWAAQGSAGECENQNNCFTDLCDSGRCFSGNLVRAAGSNNFKCFVGEDRSNLVESKGQVLKIDNNDVRVLVEFLCYQQQLGFSAQEANLMLPPSLAWVPMYRITSLSNGNDPDTRVVLQAVIIQDGSGQIPGIFSVNNRLTNTLNDASGASQILSRYCIPPGTLGVNRDCTGNFADIDRTKGNEFPAIYDWNLVSPISVGSGLFTLPPGGGVGASLVDSTASVASGKIKGEVGNAPRDPSLKVGALNPDAYFKQYFGNTSRQDVYAKASDLSLADFVGGNFGSGRKLFSVSVSPSDNDKPGVTVVDKKIYVNLGVMATSSAALAKGNKDAVILVRSTDPDYTVVVAMRGDVTSSTDNGVTGYLPPFGLLYVEGNLDFRGSGNVFGTIAVEGDANLFNSSTLTPLTNASKLLDELGIRQLRRRVAWNYF